MADDPGNAAGRIRGHDELRLSDRAECLGALDPVARSALDEDRPFDAMATLEVIVQLFGHVAVVWPVPQMVVWVADQQLGFEDLFHRSIMSGFCRTGCPNRPR